MTQYGQNAVLEPQLHSNIPGRNFGYSKKLIGAGLSIVENVRIEGQGQYISEYGQNLKIRSCGHNRTKYGTEYCFGSHD